MKKLLSLSLVLALALSVTAQQGYRYSIVPGSNNKYAVPYKEIKAITYAATKTLAPTQEETTYDFAQLTGAMTVSVTITPCYTGDRMTCLFNADGTDRVVTFASQGFSPNGTLTVAASTYAAVHFVFNGSKWQEVSRQNSLTQTFTTVNATTVSTNSVTTGYITEKTAGAGITLQKQTFQLRTATTYTATGAITVTAAELAGGLLVAATSTATTTFTLPTAAQIVTQTGATAGTTFEFVVTNASAADNGTVTVAVGSGITASDFPGTNTLTRTGSVTVGVAVFRITFITTSAAVLTRIG